MAAASKRRCFKNAGQIYYGDVQESGGAAVRHGQGTQILMAKTVDGEDVMWGRYTGGWKSGKMHGTGTYRWSDGSCYEGAFSEGRLHGTGTLTWPEGSSYDGMWNDGEMTGQGCFLNAFDGITMQGVFYRNSFRDRSGKWIDVRRRRQEQRAGRLQIGTVPAEVVATQMPVYYCEPENTVEKVFEVLRESPHLVPLVVAETTCPKSPEAAAPLWCLQAGARGCTPESSVHLSYAATEKRRRRDSKQIFRSAVREALLTGRPFTLVFGEATGEPQAGEDEPDLPPEWSLNAFFDRLSLPPDLFDLENFHGSGDVDLFLPPEKRGWQCAELQAEGGDAGGDAEGKVLAPTLAPATAHLLNAALVSLTPLPDIEPDAVRQRLSRRFQAHLPLHRIAAVVVAGP